jgi:hypothetical protein
LAFIGVGGFIQPRAFCMMSRDTISRARRSVTSAPSARAPSATALASASVEPLRE